MQILDRGRPMRAIHRKTGETGHVEKVNESKALTVGKGLDQYQTYFDRYGQPKDDFCPWRVENIEVVECDVCHAEYPPAPVGHIHKCGRCPDGECRPVTYTEAAMELGRANSIEKSYVEPEPETTPVDKALWERVCGLVRGCADRWNYPGGIDKMQDEARAIVELLGPVGVDEAEDLMKEFYLSDKYDPKSWRHADTVKAAIAFALERGRALERGK